MQPKRKFIPSIILLPIGALVAAYYLLNQQWVKAILTFFLSILMSFIAMGVKFIKGVKRHSERKMDQRAERLADWIITKLEKFIIKQWQKLTSGFKRKYFHHLRVKYHQYRSQVPKTSGAFPLEMSKVFIPLRLVPESLGHMSSEMIRERRVTGGLNIWNFLASKDGQANYQRIAVIGSPGSGKTTLLEHLVLTYAQKTQRLQNRRSPKLIPVLIHIREVKNRILVNPPPALPQLIEDQSYISNLSPPPDWFEDKLRIGKCLVMFDGLDEVADAAQRQEISQWVNRQMEDYHRSFFILTSRPYGYESDLIHPDIFLEVQPFDLSEMKMFVSKWYLQTEIKEQMRKEDAELREAAQLKADDLVSRILNSPPLAAMAINPLLLNMIATVHRHQDTLPEHRVKLYSAICEALLGRRDEVKKIPDPISADKKQYVLQVLALALTKMGTLEFTLDEGASLIQDVLANITNNLANPIDFLHKIENGCGLIVEKGPETYEFAHRSFQDFLTAVQIKEIHQEYILIQNVDNDWWAETTRLYAAQSDATEVISAALNSPTINSLSLAADCLQEAKIVAPTVRQQLELTLSAGLESGNSNLARLVATVRLSQRLNKLLRVNENISIDTSYITCAEYQLFINDKLKVGEYYQPDHWRRTSFPKGYASEAITGIRATDAKEFCYWLTKHRPLLGFNYELPDKTLIESFPAMVEQFGCWAQNGSGTTIVSGNPALIDSWRQLLITRVLHAVYSDIGIKPSHNRDLDNLLEQAQRLIEDFDFDHALENALQFESDIDINAVYNFHHFKHSVDEESAMARADILNRLRNQVFSLGKGLIPNNDLSVALDYAFNRSLLLTENEPRSIATIYLRFYALLNLFFWFLRLDDIDKTGKISSSQPREFPSDTRAEFRTRYSSSLQKAYNTYVYLVLLEARSNELLSSWEGIRITRVRTYERQ